MTSRLPSDVTTDAASDGIICRKEFWRYEPATLRKGSGYESNCGCQRIPYGGTQPKRQKDDGCFSMEGLKRQCLDSGLGDSLLKEVEDCDIRLRGDATSITKCSLESKRSEILSKRQVRGTGKESSLNNMSKGRQVSLGKDEGYHSFASTGSESFNFDAREFYQKLLVRKNADGDTTLHLMIIYNLIREISYLIGLASSSSQLNIVNEMQQSPLILAALTRQAKVVRMLLVAGADIVLRDRHGDTALTIAARNGDMDTIEALTKPVVAEERSRVKYCVETQRIPQNLNMKNYDGYAPIHVAAAEGHCDVVEYLVDLGADVDEMEGKSGLRPIHLAIECGDRELIRVLVEECSADIDATTFYGLSPVQLAVERGLDDVVVYLVNAGADRTDLEVPEMSESEDDVEDMEVEFKDLKINEIPVYK